MKTLWFSLMAFVLIAGLVLNPFSTAPVSAASCGDTYTVLRGDYLTKIAQTCGVSYSSLLAANPEIKDPNKIYTGQVIRIKASATLPTTSSYVVVRGDTLFLISVRFGTTVAELLKLNPQITNASKIYAGQVIKVPAGSTSGGVPVTGSGVTLSTSSVKPGGKVTVTVRSFPANAEIDFRLGKSGSSASVIVDGKTNASGVATVTLTIPSTAKSGEKWVVKVLTTERPRGQNKEVNSPLITIAN